MKKLSIALLTALLTLALALPATASSLGYNEGALTLPGATQVVSGQTMVPAAWLCQLLGVDFSLEEAAGIATLTKNQTTVTLTQGKKTVRVNGRARSLTVAPRREGGHFLVPLKATAEFFGAKVTFDKVNHRPQLTYRELKDGKSPTQWMADTSVAMQQLDSYRMSGNLKFDVTLGSPDDSMNLAFAALVNGAFQKPDQVYSRVKMILPAFLADTEDEMVAETYLQGGQIYTRTSQDSQWQKMESPLTAEMMTASLSQNPAQIKAMLEKFGVAASFGTDKIQGGQRLVVVNTRISPEALAAMVQEMAAQSGEKLESQEVVEMLAKIKLDMGIRSYIDAATLYTQWSDIYGTLEVEEQGTQAVIQLGGIMDFGGFNEKVEMPDVSQAVAAP